MIRNGESDPNLYEPGGGKEQHPKLMSTFFFFLVKTFRRVGKKNANPFSYRKIYVDLIYIYIYIHLSISHTEFR